MIYDGDCHFCALWIRRWRQSAGEAVDFLPSQDPAVAGRFPEISQTQYEWSIVLIEPGGRVRVGAEAVLRALDGRAGGSRFWRAYQRRPGLARLLERGYRLVADHRPFFSRLTRLAYGNHVERPAYQRVRGMFLRALGVIYFTAFVSLWVQIDGLVGSRGIEPADRFMAEIRQQADRREIGGFTRWWLLPTFGWMTAGDASLHVHCAAGSALALLLVAGIAPAPCLFLLWLIYLSLSGLCGVFLNFQWDILLLETGFVAIFLAPLRLWPFGGGRPRAAPSPPSPVMVWLLRLLLFKLLVQSGWVKLLSGDPMWRDLTALTVHYETQPLPTWIGWYAHQLPVWWHQLSCLLLFGVELVVPWFIFAPRRFRFAAAGCLAALQGLILLTGNYTFFNWLTLALCLWLLDDFVVERWLPRRRRIPDARDRGSETPADAARGRAWPRGVLVTVAVVLMSISASQMVWMFGWRPIVLRPVAMLQQWLAPFRSCNNYGLFAVMTRTRPEIIVEGSLDGETWRAYEFKHKPGDLRRRPGFVAPHQPRLDWQMWFAALGSYRNNPWFTRFCGRLLEGEPEVLALLADNPFPADPPRYVRARLYRYQFTDLEQRETTGAWWRRELQGLYLPVLSR